MHLIDSHSHLYLEDFSHDRAAVIDRAKEKGVGAIILPNIDSESVEPMHRLAAAYPDYCIPLIGLHPTHVKENYETELKNLFERCTHYEYKAIGEIGIDLYWDRSYFHQQQKAFEFQLRFARDHDLPVVIHARDSFAEILAIVGKDEFKGLRGIFHAFTGDTALARQIIDLGYLLGVGGILTFKNSHLPEVIRTIDLDHLVLETDSPYLAPTPFRGKRNESSYVYYVAERLASIKEVSIEKVAEITTQNAQKLFKL